MYTLLSLSLFLLRENVHTPGVQRNMQQTSVTGGCIQAMAKVVVGIWGVGRISDFEKKSPLDFFPTIHRFWDTHHFLTVDMERRQDARRQDFLSLIAHQLCILKNYAQELFSLEFHGLSIRTLFNSNFEGPCIFRNMGPVATQLLFVPLGDTCIMLTGPIRHEMHEFQEYILRLPYLWTDAYCCRSINAVFTVNYVGHWYTENEHNFSVVETIHKIGRINEKNSGMEFNTWNFVFCVFWMSNPMVNLVNIPAKFANTSAHDDHFVRPFPELW